MTRTLPPAADPERIEDGTEHSTTPIIARDARLERLIRQRIQERATPIATADRRVEPRKKPFGYD